MNNTLLLLTGIIVGFLLLIFIIIKVGRKYNLTNWGHPVTNIVDGWLRFYCQHFHRQGDFQIALPDDKKLILVCNHLSAIDPFLIIAATNRPIRFMIAKEEYEKPILNRLFKAAGCIPVDRGGRVEGAFRSALRAINAGELVAVFPQGGIHSQQTPRTRIKPGIIKLSQLSGCTILPIRINGLAAPGSMVKCIFKRSRIFLDVSQPLSPKQVQAKEFRSILSDWFIGKKAKIEL